MRPDSNEFFSSSQPFYHLAMRKAAAESWRALKAMQRVSIVSTTFLEPQPVAQAGLSSMTAGVEIQVRKAVKDI
jgi:hypothetical protein